MPVTCYNIWNAITNEKQPSVLTRTSESKHTKFNKNRACKFLRDIGLGKYGCTADEYPFASTTRGVKHATCESVTPQESTEQTKQISQFYNDPNGPRQGEKFRVSVPKPASKPKICQYWNAKHVFVQKVQ